MNIKYLLLLLHIFFLSTNIFGQNYSSLAGLRVGAPFALSYKQIIDDNKALEGYLGTRGKDGYRFVNISGAYQIIQPIDLWSIEELYYYYGVGASIYFWSFEEDGPNQSTTPGLQGYLGVEHTFEDQPINLTLEWRPSLFLSGHLSGLRGGYFSIGVRYVLDRDGSNIIDTQ